ncbi:septation protein SepH [Bifidobacterium xylocopae]|uniref:DUF3071 domain-containing protein n=1 Tax=Bifidobacterium xylocopae TaxID=2493119 RepID=A0A366KCV0_9BIFI|nr:septation protein SepH [Bifidobacterium xylocopae]RBP99550.1 hypothetical protein CRD59_03215 [Bifidobacterium xylocopae]
MPQEEIAKARFDHVSEHGELVFAHKRGLFAVTVDNALDRAILEAKQILEEEHGTPVPHASATLPISAIQTAIRAGFSTEQVAQEFAVNEALVRRFANPIETEKKYAVEQFLSMTAPKRGSAGSNQEAINRALGAAEVPLGSITWSATRENQGPWKIRASFRVADRAIQADWTWNMRENTITCLNMPAKQLLEGSGDFLISPTPAPAPQSVTEQATQAEAGMAEFPSEPDQSRLREAEPAATGPATADGDQSRIRTIEMATVPVPVNEPAREAVAVSEKTESTRDSKTTEADAGTNTANPSAGHPVAPAIRPELPTPSAVRAEDHSPVQPERHLPVPPPADTSTADGEETPATPPSSEPSALTAWMYGGTKRMKETAAKARKEKTSNADNNERRRTPPQQQATGRPKPQAGPQGGSGDTPKPTGFEQSDDKKSSNQPNAHKKAGRSAVPSWDEILFGD